MKILFTSFTLLLGVALGGIGYQWVSNAKADAGAKHWQYQCFEASGVAQVTARSNKLGAEGWELVTSAGGKKSTVWCFKRSSVKVISAE